MNEKRKVGTFDDIKKNGGRHRQVKDDKQKREKMKKIQLKPVKREDELRKKIMNDTLIKLKFISLN